MVLTSGFTNTPITRLLILLYTTTSILTTLLSIKHLLPIRPTPHLWPYLQLSRLLTFQLASTASTNLLITTILLYTFRVLERLYGPRKYLSFLLLTLTLSALLTVFLGSTLTAFTLTRYNYIPAGLTPPTFACLAAYTHEVPGLYRWRVLLPTGSRSSGGGSARLKGLTFSDKSTTYLLATQLALSQFPYNLLPAGVGWVIGTAWVGDMLLPRWRVKGWVVGEGRRDRERERYEGLRRRLEEDNAGRDDGMRQAVVPPPTTAAEDAGRRRGVVGQVGEFVRGIF
jgi:membrane associated rhomboid family serine protease